MAALDLHGVAARVDRAMRLSRQQVLHACSLQDELREIKRLLSTEHPVECFHCGGTGVVGGLVVGDEVVDEVCARCDGFGDVRSMRAVERADLASELEARAERYRAMEAS